MTDDRRDSPKHLGTKELRFVIEGAARRFLQEDQFAPDPERLAQGWERRFVTDGERARQMIQLYKELGYEVVADPITPESMADECADCALLAALKFQTIYTRRRSGGHGRSGDRIGDNPTACPTSSLHVSRFTFHASPNLTRHAR